ELRKALGYEKANLSSDFVHVTFNLFLSEILNTTDSTAGYVLKAANAILVDKRFELLEKYRNNATELYEAVVRDLDFSRDAPEVVEEINSWVREKTDGEIEKLFDDLSPSTLLVLLNAVYFKGTWKTQFDPTETRDEIFFNNGLELEGRKVPLMHMTSLFLYDSIDNFQVLELPFKGENVSMLILLPNKHDGLHSLEDSLTPEKLAEIQERLEETKVDVSLPKFKLDFDEELSEEIQAIGANHIFNADGDFSGMTPSTGVFVSEIRHKAIIEVNEEGSEAAAVTGNLIDRMKSPQFRADHPFFFAIVEKSSNMILFMGRVNNL
ncbi:Serpin B4, partial [Araneus ventricosus]